MNYKVLAEKAKKYFSKISEVESHPEYYTYLAANIVLTLFFMNIFFWLLWALLVFKGGIFPKIPAVIKVIFTKKTLADFGYEGYPYEMGVFEGYPTNVIALFLLIGFIILCWKVYNNHRRAAG